MSLILIVGGYGGFGGRLARRLAGRGHEVLVGGRSDQRAAAFCKAIGAGRPVAIDRSKDCRALLAREKPLLLIDAAGPFQDSDYRLAEACIHAGVHYLDLADARDFVSGIAALDGKAREAGVAIISGASSVPALSHAAVAKLGAGMERIDAVEMAISASSRASAGDSVASAILGGVGRPVKLWRGRRWTQSYGWQMLRRQRFELPCGKKLRPRLVALADVPDLESLPPQLPGVSAVTFRAGTESRIANLGLWIASWLVRARLLPPLAGAKRMLVPLHRLTRLWGSDRSAMIVRLFGRVDGKRIERRWTLIAEQGYGPEIPTLAAAILSDRIETLQAGARHAGGLLSLADFQPDLASLAVEQAINERPLPMPLYAKVMGENFHRLAPAVQAMHDVLRDHGASGEATVTRGAHPLARLVAWIMRFPPAGAYPVHVHFEERDGAERWTRDFGGYRFSSRLTFGGHGELVERFGPLRFHFRLSADDGRLGMHLQRWSFLRIPMPLALGPKTPASEWEHDGAFQFDVAVSLPLIGPVVHYRGWLRP